jgi:hypothetical protein
MFLPIYGKAFHASQTGIDFTEMPIYNTVMQKIKHQIRKAGKSV